MECRWAHTITIDTGSSMERVRSQAWGRLPATNNVWQPFPKGRSSPFCGSTNVPVGEYLRLRCQARRSRLVRIYLPGRCNTVEQYEIAR